MQIFEYEGGNLVDIDVGLIIVLARLVTCSLAPSRSLTRLALTPYYVADFALSVAGANVFLFSVIESEFVLVKRADGNLDHAPAIREYYRFVRDNGPEVLLYGLA